MQKTEKILNKYKRNRKQLLGDVIKHTRKLNRNYNS